MSKISLKHSGGNVVSLNSPTSAPASADVAFKLPNADGTNGQVLKTDGSGNLSFGDDTGGKILQVKSTPKLNTFSTSSTSFQDITDFYVDITPNSASNKFLVSVDLKIGPSNTAAGAPFAQLVRVIGGTSVDIYKGTADGNKTSASWGREDNPRDNFAGYEVLPLHLSFLDSISGVWTSGSIRYKMQLADLNGTESFINRVSNETNTVQYPRTASSITVMEVVA